MKKVSIFIFSIIAISCTENERAKEYGGTAELELPKGQKLINVTWKDTDLWYLTRSMKVSDSAETYEFKEKSSWGTWEGSYIIKEIK